MECACKHAALRTAGSQTEDGADNKTCVCLALFVDGHLIGTLCLVGSVGLTFNLQLQGRAGPRVAPREATRRRDARSGRDEGGS